MRPKHNFNPCGVSRIALLTAACALTLAMSGAALAQDITVGAGETKTATVNMEGTKNVTIEEGGVVTTGMNPGVAFFQPNLTLRNDGEITGSPGVVSAGDNATITNNGEITATGNNSGGILAAGANATITLTSRSSITATGNNAFAVQGGSGFQTLNIQPGAQILGRIDGAGGNDLVNILVATRAVASATYTFEGGGDDQHYPISPGIP